MMCDIVNFTPDSEVTKKLAKRPYNKSQKKFLSMCLIDHSRWGNLTKNMKTWLFSLQRYTEFFEHEYTGEQVHKWKREKNMINCVTTVLTKE